MAALTFFSLGYVAGSVCGVIVTLAVLFYRAVKNEEEDTD